MFIKLVQDNETSLAGRQKGSDAWEMHSFYQHYNETYIQPLLDGADKADRYVVDGNVTMIRSLSFFAVHS